jgi:hypothetical protein
MVIKITTLPNVKFWFSQNGFRKDNGVCAGRSTWRVRPWHECGSGYLEGTAEELGDGHVGLTMVFLQLKGVSPFLEHLIKFLISKIVFHKDIEMSYDMLYRQEKTC